MQRDVGATIIIDVFLKRMSEARSSCPFLHNIERKKVAKFNMTNNIFMSMKTPVSSLAVMLFVSLIDRNIYKFCW